MTTKAATNGTAKKPIEIFTATELMAMNLPEPRWAVPGVIPVGLTILVGKAKIGKSWLCLDLAHAVAFGGYVLGKLKVEPGEVLYLALEDNKRRLQDRNRKRLQGEDAPRRLTFSIDWPRQDEGGMEHLSFWLAGHPETRLVIVDTLVRFRRRRGANHKGSLYEADYDDIAELRNLADRFGVAIVVVHHAKKADAEDVMDEINGSTGLLGAANATIVLKRQRGKADAFLYATGHDLPEELEWALRWDRDLVAWTLLGDAAEYQQTQERQAVIDAIRAAGGEASPKDVATALDKPYPTVKTLMWRMADSGVLRAYPGGRYAVAVSSNLCNPGNPVTHVTHVTQVTEVTEVTGVTGVTQVTPIGDAVLFQRAPESLSLRRKEEERVLTERHPAAGSQPDDDEEAQGLLDFFRGGHP